MPGSRRQARRTTQEVRDLTLEVATDVFARQGYASTSMRDIASRADISLSVLYRHFGSKQELLSAALLAPFMSSIKDFALAWSKQIDAPWNDDKLVREFVQGLYASLREHRKSLVTLLTVDDNTGADVLPQVHLEFSKVIQDLQYMAEQEADRRRWFSREAVKYGNPIVIAMVVGAIVFRPLLTDTFGDDDEAVIDTMTNMILHGLRLQPAAEQS
jgi:AcrR family transcriptional regulator